MLCKLIKYQKFFCVYKLQIHINIYILYIAIATKGLQKSKLLAIIKLFAEFN